MTGKLLETSQTQGKGWIGHVGKILIGATAAAGLKNLLKGNSSPYTKGAIAAGSALAGGIGGALIYLDHRLTKKKREKAAREAEKNKPFNPYTFDAKAYYTRGGNMMTGSGHQIGMGPKEIHDIIHHHAHMAWKRMAKEHPDIAQMGPLSAKHHDMPLGIHQLHINPQKLVMALDKLKTHQDAQEGGKFNLGKSIKHGLAAIGKETKVVYAKAKRIRDKSIDKLKDFAAGKTKFKPSQLASYLAGATSLAGAATALIPGVDLISVPTAAGVSAGLSGLSTILKTSGRGVKLSGGAAPQMFPGEKHIMMTNKMGKRVRGNWCGPGTHIQERLKLGTEPVNDVDAVCKTHDLDYYNVSTGSAKNLPKKEKEKLVRQADAKMLNSLKNKSGVDAFLARTAIKGKVGLENIGVLNKLKYAGGGELSEDAAAYHSLRQKLKDIGETMPSDATEFFIKNPGLAKKLMRSMNQSGGNMYGAGMTGKGLKDTAMKWLKKIGIPVGIGGAAAFAVWALKNPQVRSYLLKEIGAKLVGMGRQKTVGTKIEVWNGIAKKTSGGLIKSDLMTNKRGKVVSKRKHAMGQKLIKNLQ